MGVCEHVIYTVFIFLICLVRKTVIFFSMTNNTVDMNSFRQMEALKLEMGLEEARRLGFITQNKDGITGITLVGFAYLVYVKACGVQSLPEAFAAGWHYSDVHRQDNSGAS